MTIEFQKYNPFYDNEDPFRLLKSLLPIGAFVSPHDRIPGLSNDGANNLSNPILNTQC